METLHTRKEVADLLSISPRTLDRYVKRGLIECYKMPAGPRFSVAQIYDFLCRTYPGFAEMSTPEVV